MSGTVVVLPGSAAVNWRGIWVSTTAYNANDGVYYGSASYQCIVGNTGSQPDISPTKWQPTPLQTGAGGSVVITGSPTAWQLKQAIRDNLSGGLFQLDAWIPEGLDNSYRGAFQHAIYATSLSPVVLAYMQASAAGNPAGLGLTSLVAQTRLANLMAAAVAYPR
jgi:hypothetical protein